MDSQLCDDRIDPLHEDISSKPFIYEIPRSEIIAGRKLGEGGYGTVHHGLWNNIDVAIKVFRFEKGINSFKNELKQLSEIKHKHIVNLFGSCHKLGSRQAWLVMELGEKSLSHLLYREATPYNLKKACSWVYQTADALKYCHEQKPKPLIHRDLKPDNVLLFMKGKWVKICDFGIATPEKTNQTNNVGTFRYMAPEVFKGSSYDAKCDVFSWSIMFWEILARKTPYLDEYKHNTIGIPFEVSDKGLRPRMLKDCPKIIWDLIERSWNLEPANRPDMKRIVQEMKRIGLFAGISMNNDKLNQTK